MDGGFRRLLAKRIVVSTLELAITNCVNTYFRWEVFVMQNYEPDPAREVFDGQDNVVYENNKSSWRKYLWIPILLGVSVTLFGVLDGSSKQTNSSATITITTPSGTDVTPPMSETPIVDARLILPTYKDLGLNWQLPTKERAPQTTSHADALFSRAQEGSDEPVKVVTAWVDVLDSNRDAIRRADEVLRDISSALQVPTILYTNEDGVWERKISFWNDYKAPGVMKQAVVGTVYIHVLVGGINNNEDVLYNYASRLLRLMIERIPNWQDATPSDAMFPA
jgi:hypothetical protein